MHLPRPMRIAFTAPVLALAVAATPALADGHGHDGPPPPPPPAYAPPANSGPAYPGQVHPMMAPQARANWLAECHARADRHRKRYAADYCETYLDDYYAQYSAPQPAYGYQGGYPGAAYGYPAYAGGCCNAQPMMLVPIVRVQQPKQECKEVVEYEYVDVPVRAVPRRPVPRPAPDKRVKIVPDKRIKTN